MASSRQQDAGYGYGAGAGRGKSKGGPSISSNDHKGMNKPEMAKAIQASFSRPRQDMPPSLRRMNETNDEFQARRRREFEEMRKNPRVPEGWKKPNPLSEQMQARKDLLANARKAYGQPKEVKTSKVPLSEAVAAERERRERNRERQLGMQDRRSRGEREA